MTTKYAFRCKSCGRLETSEQAAELEHPAACRVCGGGRDLGAAHKEMVSQIHSELVNSKLSKEKLQEIVGRMARNLVGSPTLDPSNWEVLADCNSKRLKELGLSSNNIEKHTPWKRGEVPQEYKPRHFMVVAEDSTGVSDKVE
jgi:hypothetical protein